ncbi:MAG: hypothetical protein JWN70_547 [Planctomycetaceae bacterium]|nr:hypothetical protein [Planctomycetaceae bacterium]
MSVRSSLFFHGLLAFMCVVGCGGSTETLVPVGGKLLIDGQPLDGVVVTFIPEVKVKNRIGGTGTTDAAGAFTVTDLDQNKPGLPVGKYTLSYSRRRLPDGSAGPAPGTASDPGIIRVETLPTYLVSPDPKLPANQVDIPKEGNTKLELKASKKSSPALMGPG